MIKASYRVLETGQAIVTIKCPTYLEQIVVLNEAHAINLVDVLEHIAVLGRLKSH